MLLYVLIFLCRSYFWFISTYWSCLKFFPTEKLPWITLKMVVYCLLCIWVPLSPPPPVGGTHELLLLYKMILWYRDNSKCFLYPKYKLTLHNLITFIAGKTTKEFRVDSLTLWSSVPFLKIKLNPYQNHLWRLNHQFVVQLKFMKSSLDNTVKTSNPHQVRLHIQRSQVGHIC